MVPYPRSSVEDAVAANDWRLVPLTECDPEAQAALYMTNQQSLIESGQAGAGDVTERGARSRLSWIQGDIEAGDVLGYAIQEVPTGEPVGEVIATGLNHVPEIEYFLIPRARGKGIARKAVRTVIDGVFASKPVDDVVFEIRHNNIPSQHVAEAVGAVRQSANGSQYETWRVHRD